MAARGRVVLGGTFDRLHAGHEALLRTAFEVGRTVAIGLTSERFLRDHPKPLGGRIASLAWRRRALVRWLSRRYPRKRWTVRSIDDPLGGAADEAVDAVVVSADTRSGGRAVNLARRRRGRPAVPLVVVPLVLADDLEPLSSRRIRAGEVDREGHRRSPLDVVLSVTDASDAGPATRGIRTAFPGARVRLDPMQPARAPRSRRPPSASLPGLHRQTLRVTLVRSGPAVWTVSVGGPHVRLNPRRVRAGSPQGLTSEVAGYLRPSPLRAARRTPRA